MTTIKANSPEQELEWARAERIRCDNDLAEATHALEAAQERERKAQKAVEKTYGQGNHASTECREFKYFRGDWRCVVCARKERYVSR